MSVGLVLITEMGMPTLDVGSTFSWALHRALHTVTNATSSYVQTALRYLENMASLYSSSTSGSYNFPAPSSTGTEHYYDPSDEEAVTSESLGLSGQPV